MLISVALLIFMSSFLGVAARVVGSVLSVAFLLTVLIGCAGASLCVVGVLGVERVLCGVVGAWRRD